MYVLYRVQCNSLTRVIIFHLLVYLSQMLGYSWLEVRTTFVGSWLHVHVPHIFLDFLI